MPFCREEEQRRERALSYKISRSKRYKACSDVGEGWELKPYADENGKQIKELYDQTGALVTKSYIDRMADGPVYEARESTLQESRDENGDLQRSYIAVDGIPISEQYKEGNLDRIDYDRAGNTAYERYYDNGIGLTYFTADGTEGYKFYEADSFLSHESYTYADGTELQIYYRENHVLESKSYTDAKRKRSMNIITTKESSRNILLNMPMRRAAMSMSCITRISS